MPRASCYEVYDRGVDAHQEMGVGIAFIWPSCSRLRPRNEIMGRWGGVIICQSTGSLPPAFALTGPLVIPKPKKQRKNIAKADIVLCIVLIS